MEQHDMGGTHRREHVLDTVAFGSMLVFASVMPPLGADAAEADSPGTRQSPGAASEGDLLGPSAEELRARRPGASLDS